MSDCLVCTLEESIGFYRSSPEIDNIGLKLLVHKYDTLYPGFKTTYSMGSSKHNLRYIKPDDKLFLRWKFVSIIETLQFLFEICFRTIEVNSVTSFWLLIAVIRGSIP